MNFKIFLAVIAFVFTVGFIGGSVFGPHSKGEGGPVDTVFTVTVDTLWLPPVHSVTVQTIRIHDTLIVYRDSVQINQVYTSDTTHLTGMGNVVADFIYPAGRFQFTGFPDPKIDTVKTIVITRQPADEPKPFTEAGITILYTLGAFLFGLTIGNIL